MTDFVVSEEQAKQRLDIYVVTKMPELSRAFIRRLCDTGKITVNGIEVKAGYKLKAGESVQVDYDLKQLDEIPDIKLPVLYEDDDCLVIDKPVGVLTHSKGEFNPEATVATFLRSYLKDMEGSRAGIVHRLDRATSGVIICAKNQAALSWLQKQFSQRKAKKTYVAIVQGSMRENEALIDMPIERNPKAPATFRVGVNGKHAKTHYKVLETNNSYSLLELKPETGRTHQLRVHLAQLGHPIVGDTIYGGKPAERLYLHAHQLELTLPSRDRKTFTSPVPPEFARTIERDA
ncbi:MAG TPA: RluA family pseudouridine synthase [Candidatus Saccharimonadales bacterium]|nr:RluA family pseudouridine synthase [Candidatus Saccharimonadales bacterium]